MHNHTHLQSHSHKQRNLETCIGVLLKIQILITSPVTATGYIYSVRIGKTQTQSNQTIKENRNNLFNKLK